MVFIVLLKRNEVLYVLKKYLIQIKPSKESLDKTNRIFVFDKDLHTLWNSVLRLPFMKKNHLPELEGVYFKGMRENWFPLILLNLYDLLMYDNKKDEADEVLDYFKSLCDNPNLFSFYIDDGYISKDAINLVIRCDGHYRDFHILDILNYYNITSFRIQEIKA